jgi:hypothetical protein
MANGDLLELPKWLKLIMAFIDRVGFPVMAFLLMWYMSSVSIAKINCTLETVTKMLGEWQTSTLEFRSRTLGVMDDIKVNQKTILYSLDRLHDKVKTR